MAPWGRTNLSWLVRIQQVETSPKNTIQNSKEPLVHKQRFLNTKKAPTF